MGIKDNNVMVVIDVETTDLDETKAHMVEIALLRIDAQTGVCLGEYSSLIKPENGEWDFHPEIAHWWDGVDWSEAKPLAQVMKEVLEFLEPNDTLAGHHPSFDLRFLKASFATVGIIMPKLDYHLIDTCGGAVFLVLEKRIPTLGLRHLRKWAGRIGEQSHRALGDAYDCVQSFKAMHRIVKFGLWYEEQSKNTPPLWKRVLRRTMATLIWHVGDLLVRLNCYDTGVWCYEVAGDMDLQAPCPICANLVARTVISAQGGCAHCVWRAHRQRLRS